MSNRNRNVLILLWIIILDFMGFTLIFPLVPDLLLFYIQNPVYHIDSILIHFFYKIDKNFHSFIGFQPEIQKNVILIIGGIMSSLYSILQFMFAPLWGKLSDQYGRKKILIFTSGGLAFSYLFWFFSRSFLFFLISRIIGGIMAGNLGVASAAMADMSQREKRTAYMGLVGMAFGLGFILGPVLGGVLYYTGNHIWNLETLMNHYSFIHPFSVCALGSLLLALLSLVLNIFFLQETFSLDQVQTRKITINPFYHFQYLDTKIKQIAFLNLIYMLIFTSYEFTFTFFYKFQFFLSPKEIGYVFFYLGILIAFGQGFLSRIVSGKVPEIYMIRLGIVILPLTFLLQPIFTSHIWLSLMSLIPLAIGNSLFQPSINSYASLLSKKEEQGYILGVLRSLGSFARAFGPIMGGTLYWVFGIQITYLILAVILLISLYITFKI